MSATPLDAVTVEPRGEMVSDIWLRRNIRETNIESEDSLSQTMWEADVVSGTLPGLPSVSYVRDRFAQLWSAFEEADMTDRELMELRSDTLGEGLAEVAGISAESADMVEVLSQAVEELASIIGGE
jgi:hypothetical protein